MKPKYIVWMCRFRRVYLEALLPDDEAGASLDGYLAARPARAKRERRQGNESLLLWRCQNPL